MAIIEREPCAGWCDELPCHRLKARWIAGQRCILRTPLSEAKSAAFCRGTSSSLSRGASRAARVTARCKTWSTSRAPPPTRVTSPRATTPRTATSAGTAASPGTRVYLQRAAARHCSGSSPALQALLGLSYPVLRTAQGVTNPQALFVQRARLIYPTARGVARCKKVRERALPSTPRGLRAPVPRGLDVHPGAVLPRALLRDTRGACSLRRGALCGPRRRAPLRPAPTRGGVCSAPGKLGRKTEYSIRAKIALLL